MNAPALSDQATINVQQIDELLKWELRIAQRADQLASTAERSRARDLACWLQAEDEVLAGWTLPPAGVGAP